MNEVIKFLSDHATVINSIVGVAGVAAITNMPKPGTPLTWSTIYTWLYETAQCALPINRSHQVQQPMLLVPPEPQPKQTVTMPPRYGVK
jgi:hypothetical protein